MNYKFFKQKEKVQFNSTFDGVEIKKTSLNGTISSRVAINGYRQEITGSVLTSVKMERQTEQLAIQPFPQHPVFPLDSQKSSPNLSPVHDMEKHLDSSSLSLINSFRGSRSFKKYGNQTILSERDDPNSSLCKFRFLCKKKGP